MPVPSKAIQYTASETLLKTVSDKAFEVLGVRPFRWQLEAAVSILSGEDVILDVGTGSGKSLCFMLPLLLDAKDISITVSPLTALMVDQTSTVKLSSVTVCQETIQKVGATKLYEDIVNGKFQQVYVSPEIATSTSFQQNVLSKTAFALRVRAVNIDEAHCITLWGGSFRKDYANLGILRGRFAKNVPFLVASATLPKHVLGDIRSKLKLSATVKHVKVTNARPNIALSVRAMQHSDESKADLRFLIPSDAKSSADIPISLVFCNSRIDTEDCADRMRSWANGCGIDRNRIAFYHSSVGENRKREIEQLLEQGVLRIVFCTDAVGMGCDMRNIERVVLWGLPPTFCSLVQRVGRAGRDFNVDAEAILIVPQSIMNEGVSGNLVQDALVSTTMEGEAEATQLAEDEQDRAELLDGEGIRVTGQLASDDDDEVAATPAQQTKKKKRKISKDINIDEAEALSNFVMTAECRRRVWDLFFKNETKEPSTYPTRIYPRCCDRCEPRLFQVEKVSVVKEAGLKRGKKAGFSKQEEDILRKGLMLWREGPLLELYYPGIESISGRTLLGDDVIEKIATCGEFFTDYAHLQRHVRWALGQSRRTGDKKLGYLLVSQLAELYGEVDKLREQEEQRLYAENTRKDWFNETPNTYGT